MPLHYLPLLLLSTLSLFARAEGENTFDRFLGSLSKGTHYLHGNTCESVNEREASASLTTAAAAVCAKLGQPGALTRQTENLRQIGVMAEAKAEDKFFALLSLQHSLELSCAAGGAGELAAEDPAGEKLKNIAGKIVMLRDAKLRLAGLAAELSAKGIVGCGSGSDDETPNPIYASQGQTDPRAEGCRNLRVARLSYQAIYESVPLAGTPSMQKYLNKAQVDRSLREEDTNAIASALKTAFAGARKELSEEAARLKLLGERGGDKIDRPTRRALISDPARVQELIEAGGNTSALKGLACAADSRYGAGADSFERAVMVGSLVLTPVLGVGSLAVRGAPVLRAAAGARATGALSLTGTRLLQLGVLAAGGATSYEMLDRACWSKDSPRMVARGGAQCRDDFSVEQMKKEDCRLAGVMTSVGGVALLASSKTVQNFVSRSLAKNSPGPAPAAVRPTAEPASLANLEARSVVYSSTRDIPGGAGGPSSMGIERGRFLRTNEIRAADLPYSSEIRAVDQAGLRNPAIKNLNPGDVNRTDIVLASIEHSGSAGVVRLGSLNGRPVAIKAYATMQKDMAVDNAFILKEAADSKLMSDLGIGPKFHGIYQDSTGRWNLVTDVVRGDFRGTRVTAQSFDDLRTIEKRLSDNGVTHAPDFQPYRTQDGRMLVIDAQVVRDADRAGELAQDISTEMAVLIKEADPAVGLQQLQRIQTSEPERMATIRRIFSNIQRNTGRLPEHLRPYLE